MQRDCPKARSGARRIALVRAGLLLALVAAAAGAASRTYADMPGDIPDKFRFELGGMAADTFTEGGLGSKTAGIGATINFEDIFDLPESKNVWRVDGYWHFAKRHYLDVGYVEINRSGSRVIQEDVEWGDFIFTAGGSVTAGFDSTFAYAAWRYDFLQLPQVRISGSAGIDYLHIGSDLEATGNVTDSSGNPVSGTVNEGVDVNFPVPQFGLQLDWALTKTLAVKMYNRQIYINAMGINGGIGETTLRLLWWYSKHAGISGGLDKESIDLKHYESGDTTARFRYEVRGFAAYLNFAF